MPGCVCPKLKDMGPFFWHQGSKMSENISLKMGIEFAVSLNMDENLCWVLYIITYKSGKNEL